MDGIFSIFYEILNLIRYCQCLHKVLMTKAGFLNACLLNNLFLKKGALIKKKLEFMFDVLNTIDAEHKISLIRDYFSQKNYTSIKHSAKFFLSTPNFTEKKNVVLSQNKCDHFVCN